MATVNTIHDLFQLLRENPEWADELRTLILTTELIDLPRKFAEFAEETRAHNAATDVAISELQESQKETQSSVKELQESQMETQGDVKGLQGDVKDLKGAVGELQSTVGELQGTVKVIQDDVGELKGSNAIAAALRNPEMIVFAISEDLRREAVITSQDLIDMLRSKPDVVPQEDKMSFLEADLVVRAKDGSGEDHYITAEVSYTVGSSDVDRTVRNAGFLRELTGKQSHAVVVGNEINGTAAMIIEREGIPWYQLRRRDTRPR
ncbi:MAG: hypothetical protein OXC95_14040 [Dehalococcoidia bacterium]|nr:hypothetical protein [Dehalococcoidia bacterium]